MKRYYLALLFSISLVAQNSYAQGCSDAGFCTAGAMQSGKTTDSTKAKSSVGFSLTAGAGEKGTSIIIPQIEGQLAITKKSSIELKLPYNIASGKLGKHNGIGDIILTYSNKLIDHNNRFNLTATIGSRIGTGTANAVGSDGYALPMPYQSSLGTTDIIAGIGVGISKYFSLAAGYQQPIFQYNKNRYLAYNRYPAENDKEYFTSNSLKRKGDILLRAEGRYQWRKFMVAAGPLLIYHLGQDEITNMLEEKELLKGSEGTTLNLAGSVSYNLRSARIDILGGTPFIVRDYRADGLTRAWVITLRYTQFR